MQKKFEIQLGCIFLKVVKMVVNGVRLEPIKSTPTEIRQLMIEGCWQTSPHARLTFSDIHDILLGFVSLSLESENTACAFDYLQPLPDLNISEYI